MKILHITDLHTGWKEEKEPGAWERLQQEAEAAAWEGQRPDILAVTGDLVLHGTREEFQRTEEYIHRLRGHLGLERSRVFFCCGNHDADTPESGSSFKEYEAFLERFYGGEKPWCPVPVFDINSCKRTSTVYFNDCWLDPADVDRIVKQGENGEKGILLMHHQPEMFDDQSQIERLKAGVGLILGGHLHTGYTRHYSWKGMEVVNGVAVMPHLDFLPRGFQIVDMDEKGKTEAVMYVYRDGEKVQRVRA